MRQHQEAKFWWQLWQIRKLFEHHIAVCRPAMICYLSLQLIHAPQHLTHRTAPTTFSKYWWQALDKCNHTSHCKKTPYVYTPAAYLTDIIFTLIVRYLYTIFASDYMRQTHTCQVSRISRVSHAFSLNSRISARLNIISRILFDLSYALVLSKNTIVTNVKW